MPSSPLISHTRLPQAVCSYVLDPVSVDALSSRLFCILGLYDMRNTKYSVTGMFGQKYFLFSSAEFFRIRRRTKNLADWPQVVKLTGKMGLTYADRSRSVAHSKDQSPSRGKAIPSQGRASRIRILFHTFRHESGEKRGQPKYRLRMGAPENRAQ